MKFTVLTLFPQIVETFFTNSIMAKAIKKGLVSYQIVNIRDFAKDKHRTCDDYPYGGGAGMVLKPEPLAAALDSVNAGSKRTVYPSPSGRLFSQETAESFIEDREVVFICGRYEGVDQRIIDQYVDDELSIGDYVISSGEIASLVIIDGIYRLIDGVINNLSLEEESFSHGLLEYPHYTRPAVFQGMPVPDILLSGNHEEIRKWRRQKSLQKTWQTRKDLIDYSELSDDERKLIEGN